MAGLLFLYLKTRSMIRIAAILLMSLLIILASCRRERDYRLNTYLTVAQQDDIMGKIIRYMGKPPDGVAPEERWAKGYDEHYREQQALHRLDAYYVDGRTQYFLVSRTAPSLTEKRVAIGGALQLDEQGMVTGYVEVFRTWKMPPDTLSKRGAFLFDLMVRGNDLEPYYSSRSGNTDFIEFPDDRTYFDTATRMWKAKPR